ncbi:rhomboid-like protease 5, putative [Eimeria maxima]|uniref:Rhomboid-like protease 5, putative n=1 Tax=Eimeria maxima TaxID=5804 RepID=U6M412_EIMMA|nr:rhomboid-like protease 5, putative [Eimeria maxima]CDJ57164.1 rhomboid-like protease 5, putative [Eimeria maxima]
MKGLQRVAAAALATEQQQQQKQQQQKNQQQKVLIWGSRLSFPGGAPSDVQTPTEAETLNCLATSWVAVSFGPHFGAAIPGDGRSCVVWGSLEQEDGEPAFVSPFVLPLPQGAAPATDVQCSATEIFVLDRDGRIYVFLPEKAKAAGAACGDRHTIVLATDGSTFAFGDDSKIQLAIGDTRAPGGADVETTKQPGMDMAQDKAPVQRAVTYGVLDRHIQHEPIPSLKPPAAVSPEAALGLATAVAASDFSSIILYQRGDAATGAPVNSLLCCGETTRGIVTPARCVRLPWEVNVSSEETKKMANATGKDTDTNIQQMYIAKLSCGFSNSAVILDPKR